MVGIASITFQTIEKNHNGNPLRFQNNIPNNLKKLRCISPLFSLVRVLGLHPVPTYVSEVVHRISVDSTRPSQQPLNSVASETASHEEHHITLMVLVLLLYDSNDIPKEKPLA